MEQETAVVMRDITKTFGSVVANDHVSITIRYGEILSILGENGSGKTTLMNMLAGLYYPDSGRIFVNGREVSIRSPMDAYALGIGMVHQHYRLIEVFDAVENIVLGEHVPGQKYDLKASEARIRKIMKQYGFSLDLHKKVYEMSISEKQTLEIIKVLYRGADILILDEPTAVLTPQETEKLFAVLREMRKDSKAIVLITHKLNEVMEVCDRVSVLRRGKFIATVETKDTDEHTLTEQMVGGKVTLNIERPQPVDPQPRIVVEHLTVLDDNRLKALDDVSFTACSGEILGVAGISGSGQKELLEAIAGLQVCQPGSRIDYHDPAGTVRSLIGANPRQIMNWGVHLSFVPEDRLGMGLVGSMGMTGNMLLKDYDKGTSPFLNVRDSQHLAEEVREELDVAVPDLSTPVRRLSGGNVQKVLVGREIAASPTVLLTAYAVRGLDIQKSYTIYDLLNQQKKKGVAIIYVGEDLDVLMALSDRILVLCGGRANGMLDARTASKQEIGLHMTRMETEQEAA